MKLTFLGTSAGESYPALWCHCPNCTYAREHGGRNIRQNSCALLDDDVMLDLSSHAFHTALSLHLDISQIQYLLITHNHRDHFDPQHLIWRGLPMEDGQLQAIHQPFSMDHSIKQMGARHTELPFLEILGHESVLETMRENPRLDETAMESSYRMRFTRLTRGQTIERDHLKVTTVVSHHSQPGSVFNYIIERDGKTLLYALDCGGYDQDMYDLLKQYRFDCVVLEGTFGHMPVEYTMHQNKDKNLRMLNFFTDCDLWRNQPRMILSHMAPHWTPPYDLYAEEMSAYGIVVAYDGMNVEI